MQEEGFGAIRVTGFQLWGQNCLCPLTFSMHLFLDLQIISRMDQQCRKHFLKHTFSLKMDFLKLTFKHSYIKMYDFLIKVY